MNKLKFTDIPNKLNYKAEYKGILSAYHFEVIEYVCNHFKNNRRFKTETIMLINQISYLVYSKDSFPENWSAQINPFEPKEFWNHIYVDKQTSLIKDIFIDYMDVEWNINSQENDVNSQDNYIQSNTNYPLKRQVNITKEDLSIQPPIYPRFDTSKIWKSGIINDVNYTIYTSLPEVPLVQRDISVTTDINKMSQQDLYNLFPQTRIQTRYISMYSYVDNIKYHDILGCIPPINGFTEKQIVDNIIKYPHFYKLKKVVDGNIVNFYNTIEIDGELYKVLEIWDDLPESKKIPKQSDFIKDYVVRRYLLERDIKKIEHKYPMYGELNPFLTLFTTPDEYKKLGYTNPIELAELCVSARIAYKTSRNPVLKQLEEQNV